MQIFRHLIIGALILYLVAPEVEGGWFKKLWKKVKKGVKKVGKGIGRAAKGIWRGVKKVGCKVGSNVLNSTDVMLPTDIMQ